MSYQSSILLVIAVINLVLAVTVYLRNRKSPANFYFAMMVFVGSLWVLGLFGYSLSFDNPSLRLVMVQIIYICTLITSFYYFIFACHFPYKTFNLPKIFFLGLYIFVAIYSLVLSLNIDSIINISILTTNIEVVNFNNYLLFSLIFSAFILAGLIILFQKYKKADSIIKKQIMTVLIATALTYILASITNLITGFLYVADSSNFWESAWVEFYWLGPMFSLINVSIIGRVLFRK